MPTMRVLLTGASGFVAPYVARALRSACGDDVEIVGVAQAGGAHPDIGPIAPMDLADAVAIEATFAMHAPTHVIHLGAISAIGPAEADRDLTWKVNLMGTLRCVEALGRHTPGGVFIFAGSAQVYGPNTSGLPIDENAVLAPDSQYAVTKAAADLAIGGYARRGLKVVRFRPFNHTGPGQSEHFVVPRFAAQIARVEAGLQSPVVTVGNLSARRDFLDVRDVADAYVRAILRADALQSGVVFNLASGRAETMHWVLDSLIGLARTQVSVSVDHALWRENDIPVLLGDASRARAVLGWRPQWPIESTIREVLEDARGRVARGS